MTPDEVWALLGGYATGSLTPEEQQRLFDAALQDQDLFDELAREQALKEAFDDPVARRELLDVLDRPSGRARFAAWLRWPIPAAAGTIAVAAVATVLIVRSVAPSPVQVARIYPVEPAPMAAPPSNLDRVVPPEPAKKRNEAKVAPAIPRQTAPAIVASAPPPVPNRDFSGLVAPAAPPIVRDQTQPAASMEVQTANAVESRKAAEPQVRGVVGGYPAAAGITGGRARTASALFDPNAAPRVRYAVQQQDSVIRLSVSSNADGDLYLFRRDASGQWLPVTPGGMSLTANTPATTPSLQSEPGAPLPHALLLFSRTPLTNLAQSGAALTAEVERIRATAPAGVAVVPVTLP